MKKLYKEQQKWQQCCMQVDVLYLCTCTRSNESVRIVSWVLALASVRYVQQFRAVVSM